MSEASNGIERSVVCSAVDAVTVNQGISPTLPPSAIVSEGDIPRLSLFRYLLPQNLAQIDAMFTKSIQLNSCTSIF